MSNTNEQKVWVSDLTDYSHVKSYAISASFPNLYDYPQVHALRQEVLAKKKSPEYKDSEELANLRKKIRTY